MPIVEIILFLLKVKKAVSKHRQDVDTITMRSSLTIVTRVAEANFHADSTFLGAWADPYGRSIYVEQLSNLCHECKVSFTGWKDGVPNKCNWKLRHYQQGEWTFGPCKLDVAESSSERVVWNESIAATRNGAPFVWQRVSDTLTSSMGMLVQHGDAEA